MKSLLFLLLAMLVCIAYAQGKIKKSSRCELSGGRCLPKTNVRRICVKLDVSCGPKEVCCKNIKSRERKLVKKPGKPAKKPVAAKVPKRGGKRKCKTQKKCKKQGGKCVKAKANKCDTVTVNQLCKGQSCTCCLGDKPSCTNLPGCQSNGGFCLSKKKSDFCVGGTLNDTLCDGKKCTCCLPDLSSKNCQCGQTNLGKTSRILGGDEVFPKNKYPWVVGLLTPLRKGNASSCGGVIINNQYILTSARCLYNNSTGMPMSASDIRVSLADHNQTSTVDDVGNVTRIVNITSFKIHENFDMTKKDDNIALIKLKEPLDLSANKEIKPVCLPKNKYATYEGKLGVVAGWGLTNSSDNSSSSDVLKELTVLVLKPACDELSTYATITETMLCAGFETGKSACDGDHGGPLFVKEGGAHTLVGIVSFGFGCGKPNVPTVYTRVTKYVDWINENTKDAKYCT